MEKDKDILKIKEENIESNITFTLSELSVPLLELKATGEIYVRGELIEENKEVVEALKYFLKKQNLIQ
jgi:hypothetical protein